MGFGRLAGVAREGCLAFQRTVQNHSLHIGKDAFRRFAFTGHGRLGHAENISHRSSQNGILRVRIRIDPDSPFDTTERMGEGKLRNDHGEQEEKQVLNDFVQGAGTIRPAPAAASPPVSFPPFRLPDPPKRPVFAAFRRIRPKHLVYPEKNTIFVVNRNTPRLFFRARRGPRIP